MKQSSSRREKTFLGSAAIALMIATTGLTGCQTGEVLNNGYILDEKSLALIPVGSSREQVLLTMGTPSTTATFDSEVFYYISQKRSRPAAFMKPILVDQNVLAIYFDNKGIVSQTANYTLKDGKVFDSIARITPTGGRDLTFLQQLLTGGPRSGASAARSILGMNSGGVGQ